MGKGLPITFVQTRIKHGLAEIARLGMQEFRGIAISAAAIARSIVFAIEQPDDVDVSEIIVRLTASPY